MDIADMNETNPYRQEVPHNQPATTMEWLPGQQLPMQNRVTVPKNRKTNQMGRKKKRKKKKTWLVANNDNDLNRYYRFV